MNNIKLGDVFTTIVDLQFRKLLIPKGTEFTIMEILYDGEYEVLFDYDDSDYVYGEYEPSELIQILDEEEIEEWATM